MPGMTRAAGAALAAVLAVTGLGACGDDDQQGGAASSSTVPIEVGDVASYRPDLDPARFVEGVDHPYLPLRPGARWVYEGVEDGEVERIEVVVTDERKTILGIDAVVVRDTVTKDGVLFEDTYDWYAQDVDGNVWYLGEATEEHEDGEVSTAGSWEAGVDGALPGIVMQAAPAVGDAYRQELYPGEAEDVAEVVRLGQSIDVRAGHYDDVLVTEEWNPLEPEVLEEKSYAPGVGLVYEEKVRGGDGHVELVEFTPGASP